jgi:hypothetical protein
MLAAPPGNSAHPSGVSPFPPVGPTVRGLPRCRRTGRDMRRRPYRKGPGRASSVSALNQADMISRIRRAVSLGVLPTRTPTFSRASFFAWAVPDEPETIAPAWPIVLPSGAVKPAT